MTSERRHAWSSFSGFLIYNRNLAVWISYLNFTDKCVTYYKKSEDEYVGESMEIYRSDIYCQTTGDTDIIDITPQVTEVLRNSGIRDGVVFLFVSGSTAALTTIEYESGVVSDLVRIIEEIAPKNIPYQHNLRWGDGNGYSHVRASLLGPSLNIPVANKKLLVGPWQQVVLLDFDNKPRKRGVVIQIIGT